MIILDLYNWHTQVHWAQVTSNKVSIAYTGNETYQIIKSTTISIQIRAVIKNAVIMLYLYNWQYTWIHQFSSAVSSDYKLKCVW